MRDRLLDFLCRELIGPDPAGDLKQPNGEEILKEPPRLCYGAGVLFPKAAVAEASVEATPGEAPAAAEGAEDPLPMDPDQPEPEEDEGRRQPGAAEDPGEANDDTVALANAFLPSALGFSCLVELPKRGFVIDVEAATYESQPRPYQTKNGENRMGRQFARRPLRPSPLAAAADLSGAGVRLWRRAVVKEGGEPSGLQVCLISRPHRGGSVRQRLLTVTLVNTLSSDGRA
jgi:hypothetical protein